MKVVHIFAGKYNTGAALGALNLCKGLIKKNVNLSIVNDESLIKTDYQKIFIQNNIFYKIRSLTYNIADRIKFINYTKKIKFSSGFSLPTKILKNKIQNVDLVHLHWINNGFINLNELMDIQKPIVWTLRDMWPFTGGCHYSLNCQRFKKECVNCENLEKKLQLGKKDLVKKFFLLKKKIFEKKNFHFVAISKWLEKEALESELLKNKKIYQIYNCVDEEIFFKENMKKCRNELNLPTDKKIILFGSQKLNDPIKNNHNINFLRKELDKKKYFIISFGKNDTKNNDIKNFGFINKKFLRKLYSSADIYLSFSKQEAFGKTLVESLMCGTPVVCNDNTSSKEIVIHKKNGFIVKNNNYQIGIDWVINNLGKNINQDFSHDIKRFTIDRISEEYLQLYRDILRDSRV
jgi:glycosyltransferase involved in cell wall biosynthesis